MKGISTDHKCTTIAACLKKAGYDFIFRYYSREEGKKILTPAELQAIRSAGLQVAITYEGRYGGRGHYSGLNGRQDGEYAYRYAQRMRQPPGSAIYFAIDYDPLPEHPSDIPGRIQAYFRGVWDSFNSLGNGTPQYRIGVYGAGVVCDWVRAHLDFVEYSWLAMPAGWTGRRKYKDWNVKQSKSTIDLCGLRRFRGNDGDYETNESKNDKFGQFMPGPQLISRQSKRASKK